MHVHRIVKALVAGAALTAIVGCQATSDARPYKPANCAMVGSTCTRSNH